MRGGLEGWGGEGQRLVGTELGPGPLGTGIHKTLDPVLKLETGYWATVSSLTLEPDLTSRFFPSWMPCSVH